MTNQVTIKEIEPKRFYGAKSVFKIFDSANNQIASAFLKRKHAEDFIKDNGWKLN